VPLLAPSSQVRAAAAVPLVLVVLYAPLEKITNG